jgi:uncharacterized protein (TIGR02265 family)
MDRFWFREAVDSLFSRGLRDRMTPQLKSALKPVIDLDRPILPAYPAADVESMLGLVGEHLYPSLPVDRRMFVLGRLAFESFRTTLLGRAALQMLRIVGRDRALERLQRGFRSACNYVDIAVERIEPRGRRLRITGAGGLTHFVAGIVQMVVESLDWPSDDAHWRYDASNPDVLIVDVRFPPVN